MKIKNALQSLLAKFRASNNFYDEIFDEINPTAPASSYDELDERHRANRAISNITAAFFILLRIVALPAFAGLILLFVVRGLANSFDGPTLAICLIFIVAATIYLSYLSLNICFLSGELRNKYARQIKNNQSFKPKELKFNRVKMALKDSKIYDTEKSRDVIVSDLLWNFYLPTFFFAAAFLCYIQTLGFSLTMFFKVVLLFAIPVLFFNHYIRRKQNKTYLTLCRYF